MSRLAWVFLWFAPLVTRAQFTYSLDTSIPVQDSDGRALPMPWAGGLNAANVNTMDLNGDGKDDLVLFDRMAGKIITFLRADDRYIAAPEYEALFPSEISNWLLLRDYNCDGRKDIFTGDVLGIKVYTNTARAGAPPEWTQYFFSTGQGGSKSSVLQTQGFTTKVNLQLLNDDLPSISDVDGDGDLDILNIQYGGHTVEFHQNMSMESGLPCDSLEYKRITRAWGNFTECECGQFAFNGQSCPPNAGGRTKHAGGKSLLVLDLDGDGAQDLIFSEAACTQMYALRNQGTTFNPIFTSSSSFPQPEPVNMVIFPAAYYEDIDFDGKKDVIISPNIFSKEYLNTFLDRSTWLYRNSGTNSQPSFRFVENNLLQGDMIDVGNGSIPAFMDTDGDGDFDLLVSSHSSDEYSSAIYLYENIGSDSAPSFKLVSDDFLGFSRSNFYNVKIQFADVNSDHTRDLVFTATSFDDGATRLYYFANKSTTKMDFSGVSVQRLEFILTNSENVYLTEISGDGIPDMLVGRSEGNLEYWKNIGIKAVPLFQLVDENFLGFSSSPLRQNLACAVADLDGDGTSDLLVGDQAGNLGVIANFRSATAETAVQYDIVFNPLLESYTHKNLGGSLWPTVVNLFNTDRPAVVVGNALGGVHILRHDADRSLSDNPVINVYPNPVTKPDVLTVTADRRGTMQIISLLGQQLSTPVILQANEAYVYRLSHLAAGLYLLKFTANKKSAVQRFVIR